MNRLFFGDNLEVMRASVADESVDLIYLDPPFNSKAAYNVIYKDLSQDDAQRRAFKDTWNWEEDKAAEAIDDVRKRDVNIFNMLQALRSMLGECDLMAYIAMMSIRLLEMRRVLKPTGSIYLHCDPTASHYLKLMMDALFGPKNFRNEIIWKRSHAHSDGKQGSKHYGRVTDTILFYTRTDSFTWNIQYGPYDQEYIDRDYRRIDSDGRRYRIDNLQGPGGADKGNPYYEVMGVSRHWRYSKERMAALIDEGRIIQTRPGAVPQYKRYLDEMPGIPLQNLWTDLPVLNNRSKEVLGYPTQKPVALLERIVRSSSKEGDLILDPFCGCGTSIEAAERLNRKWVGIDVAYPAIKVIEDRFAEWMPNAKYKVSGIPFDEESARGLAARDPYVFQQWAVARLGGQPGGKGGDRGVDGQIIFLKGKNEYGRAIVSVKAGKNISPYMVRELKGTVDRERADAGIFVCVESPSKEMRIEASTQKRVELPGGPRSQIQIVTASDLIKGPNLGILTELNTVQVAQIAKKIARQGPPRMPTPQELRDAPPLPPMPLAGGRAKQQPLDLGEPLLSAPQEARQTRRRKA